MNKRGISAIVATVLIILITVAAVAIVWSVIIPLINNSIKGSSVCFDASTSLTIIGGSKTCKTKDNVSITISRSSRDFKLEDIQIQLIKSDGDSISVNAKNLSIKKGLPGINEQRVFIINKTDVGKTTDLNSIQSVKFAPIVITSDGEKKTCDASAGKAVPSCQ